MYLPTNLTSSISGNNTRVYKFLPVDVRVRLSLYMPAAVFGLYAIITNGLILYLKNTQGFGRKRALRPKSFNRFQVTSTFVQSLAISDLTCGLIMIPLAIVTNFVDVIDTDFKCRAVRFCNIFFPSVTIFNLFVIGIERYLAVFHPFKVPSLRGVRILVVAAWIMGGLFTIMPTVTYTAKKVNYGTDYYTLDCVNDNTKPINKILFIGFTVIIYVIPAIILLYTNIRILLELRKRKVRSHRENARKYSETSAFVTLIFTFILPYLLFVGFSAVRIILKPQFSYTVEYTIRKINAVLAYSNSAISPTVIIVSMRDLRTGFKNLVRNCCTNRNAALDEELMQFHINRVNQLRARYRGVQPHGGARQVHLEQNGGAQSFEENRAMEHG